MKLSIVATLYCSSATIAEFYARAVAAAEAVSPDFEIVLVNDGSPDDSREKAITLHESDHRVVLIDLARNAGHHKAIMTGLMHARGDLVFLVDSDLEEPPELLTMFHQRLAVGDCDVVYGVQERRRGSSFERVTGALYFMLLDVLSDDKIPRNLLTARLMTREYVRALTRFRDREFVISQLWSGSGFRQVAMPAQKVSRSRSTYSLKRRVHMAIKHITTTSTRLLYLIFYLGATISCLSALTILYYLARYLFAGIDVDGWTSLIISIWFFGGLTTLILGILGIYIANILSESKRRPYTIVRRVYRASKEAETASNIARLGARADGNRAR